VRTARRVALVVVGLLVPAAGFTPTRDDSRGLSTAVRLLRALP
jgi:hypothetical protein